MQSFGFLVVLFAFISSILSQPTPVNVAAMFSLTAGGKPDSAGLSRSTAFKAAVEDINANSRYNGKIYYETVYYDTQRNATLAGQYSAAAIKNNSMAVVTVVTTPETQAIMANSGTVPNVCAGANAAAFSNATAFPWFVRDIPSGSDQTSCMANIINTLGKGLSSATVYTADDAATLPIAQALLSKITSQSVSVLTGLPGSNASSAANFLTKSSANIWPIVCQANDISLILSALYALGVSNSQFVIPSVDSALTSTLLGAPNSQAVAQNLFGCTLATANTTEYQQFLVSYNRVAPSTGANNVTMDSKAAYTYDLAFIIAEAALSVLNAGGDVSNNTALMAAIRAVNFTGASGQIFFNVGSNDIAEPKTYIVKKVNATNFNQVGVYANGAFTQTDPSFTFPKTPSTTTGTTTNSTGATSSSSTTGGTPGSTGSSTSTTSSANSCASLFVLSSFFAASLFAILT